MSATRVLQSIIALAVLPLPLKAQPAIPVTFHVVAGLISTPTPGNVLRAFVGSSVIFEADAASLGGLNFEWEMGDGTHLTGAQVGHVFVNPGVVTVSLTTSRTELPTPPASVSTTSLSILQTFALGDPLVTFGGTLGSWKTELLLSNGSSNELSIQYNPVPYVCPCLGVYFQVPPYGMKTVFTTDQPGLGLGFFTQYLTPPGGSIWPSVRVRAVNQISPSETRDIPVVRLSSIIIAQPSVLSFPGATKSTTGRSSLYLTALLLPELIFGPSVSGTVEARDATGRLVATGPFSIDSGNLLVIPDVLGFLGIDSLDQAQIRVVRTSPDGYMWGLLASTYSDGSTAISEGFKP